MLYGREDTVLTRDENYTSGGVTVKIVDRIAIKSISARLVGGTAVITWDFTGTQGETAYRLVRSETLLKNTSERTGDRKLMSTREKSYTERFSGRASSITGSRLSRSGLKTAMSWWPALTSRTRR